MSTNGGSTFVPIPGATSTTLTLSATTASQNGYVYQAVFTQQHRFRDDIDATLTVHYAPIVSSNPTSQSVTVGWNCDVDSGRNGQSHADRPVAGQHQWRGLLQQHLRCNQHDAHTFRRDDQPERLPLSGGVHQQRRLRHDNCGNVKRFGSPSGQHELDRQCGPYRSERHEHRRDHWQSRSDRQRAVRYERRHVVLQRAQEERPQAACSRAHPSVKTGANIAPRSPAAPVAMMSPAIFNHQANHPTSARDPTTSLEARDPRTCGSKPLGKNPLHQSRPRPKYGPSRRGH